MQNHWLWVETKQNSVKNKNLIKFTDLRQLDTLPEFLQISRISQENYQFLRTLGERGKIKEVSRSEVQIPGVFKDFWNSRNL